MLVDQDIVCVPLAPWEGTFEGSYHHVMRRLARRNRVLWVDPPLSWSDVWRGRAYRRSPEQLARAQAEAGRHRIAERSARGWLAVLTPPPIAPVNALPDGRLYDAALGLAARPFRAATAAAMATLGMEAPILWSYFHPVLGCELLERAAWSLVVYHCVDEISSERWIAAHGVSRERRMLATADLVLTSSPGLLAAKAPLAGASAWVPHGVEAELFGRALDPGLPPAPALMDRTGPVIGFLGQVEARFDFGLVHRLAVAFPEATVAIVGGVAPQVAEPAAALAALPNVRLFGNQPRASLPAWLKAFDVAIVPYVRSPQTAAVYPLKLHEYLAAGRRVVATDFAPLPAAPGLGLRVTPPEAFVEAVREALATPPPDPGLARAHAAAHDWDQRVAVMAELVAAAAQAKEVGRACLA